MLDHMILTVSDVERSLAFYEAALKPLNIKFFMPYKGEDGHPDLWGFGDGKRAFFFWIKQGKPIQRLFIGGSWQNIRIRSMNSTKRQCPLARGTTFRPARDWNTMRDTTPPMYSTQTDIHSRSSIEASDGTAHHQGERSTDAAAGKGRRRRQGAITSARANSRPVLLRSRRRLAFARRRRGPSGRPSIRRGRRWSAGLALTISDRGGLSPTEAPLASR